MKSLACLLLLSSIAFAENLSSPTVSVSSVPLPDHNALFSFMVMPSVGFVPNYEAPWKLEIFKNHLSIKDAQYSLVRKDSSEFQICTERPPKKTESLKYRIVSYFCSTDKTSCFRNVSEGVTKWIVQR